MTRVTRSISALFIAGFLLVPGGLAQAGSLALPLKNDGAPAVDLLHQGRPIDRDEAVDLQEQGTDLSRLDPIPNDSWTGRSSAPADPSAAAGYPAEDATVDYHSAFANTDEIFRARVVSGERPYQLLVSLRAHAALALNALLRQLGYDLPQPRYYRSLSVSFPSAQARDSFLDSVSDATLTTRARWLRKPIQGSETTITLQDVVLEPAQIDVPNFHWGIKSESYVRGRRATRALIVPYSLMSIEESVNLYSWEAGKILDNAVLLNYSYSERFAEATYADARWIARRIALLTREQLVASVLTSSRLPPDLAALVAEKLVARRNDLVQLFGLAKELPENQRQLPYDSKLSIGHVKKGKATRSDYEGYAARFTYGDPKSPIRFPEILRYGIAQGLGAGIKALTNQVNKSLLTVRSVDGVVEARRKELYDRFIKNMQQNPGQPQRQQLEAWGGFYGGAGVTASREVVTGTYYGSDAKLQLVDLVTAQGNLGYFMGLDGVPYVTPGLAGNVAVSRSYLHLRPVADMKAAVKTNWGQVWVPGFMHGLGALLETEAAEASPEEIAKARASLKEGADPVSDADLAAEIRKEKLKKIRDGLTRFQDSLKEGEMMVVTDAIVVGVQASAKVNIPVTGNPALQGLNPSLGVAVGTQPLVLRRTTLSRTKDGIQVYIQNAQSANLEVEVNFNWLINLARVSTGWKKGAAQTQAYLIDQEPIDEAEDSPEPRRLAMALKALVLKNSSDLLEQDFPHYKLKHDLSAHINRKRFLIWEWASLDEVHKVRISPPGAPKNVRTLMSHRHVTTKGTDTYQLVRDIGSMLSKGAIAAGDSRDVNPATSFLGKSTWVAASTEAEITPGRPGEATSIVERHWGGWVMTKKSLLELIDKIEAAVRPLGLDRPVMRRDEFQAMKHLQMYDVLATLVVYPGAMERIAEWLFRPKSDLQAMNNMRALLDPSEAGKGCVPARPRVQPRAFQHNPNVKRRIKRLESLGCLTDWMLVALELRDTMPKELASKDPADQLRATTEVVERLEKSMPPAKLFRWLGNKNFFYQVKISGFRTRDENGDTAYVSDSLGSFSPQEGSGPFREFAADYGIVENELHGRYLSEGF